MDLSTHSLEAEFSLVRAFNEFSEVVERDNADEIRAWLKEADQEKLNPHMAGFIGYTYACLKREQLVRFHELMVQGFTDGEIASHFQLSRRTVQFVNQEIYAKLGMNRYRLIAKASAQVHHK